VPRTTHSARRALHQPFFQPRGAGSPSHPRSQVLNRRRRRSRSDQRGTPSSRTFFDRATREHQGVPRGAVQILDRTAGMTTLRGAVVYDGATTAARPDSGPGYA